MSDNITLAHNRIASRIAAVFPFIASLGLYSNDMRAGAGRVQGEYLSHTPSPLEPLLITYLSIQGVFNIVRDSPYSRNAAKDDGNNAQSGEGDSTKMIA